MYWSLVYTRFFKYFLTFISKILPIFSIKYKPWSPISSWILLINGNPITSMGRSLLDRVSVISEKKSTLRFSKAGHSNIKWLVVSISLMSHNWQRPFCLQRMRCKTSFIGKHLVLARCLKLDISKSSILFWYFFVPRLTKNVLCL